MTLRMTLRLYWSGVSAAAPTEVAQLEVVPPIVVALFEVASPIVVERLLEGEPL
jgi:hypothetical protein